MAQLRICTAGPYQNVIEKQEALLSANLNKIPEQDIRTLSHEAIVRGQLKSIRQPQISELIIRTGEVTPLSPGFNSFGYTVPFTGDLELLKYTPNAPFSLRGIEAFSDSQGTEGKIRFEYRNQTISQADDAVERDTKYLSQIAEANSQAASVFLKKAEAVIREQVAHLKDLMQKRQEESAKSRFGTGSGNQ